MADTGGLKRVKFHANLLPMWRFVLFFALLSGPSLAEGTKGIQIIDGEYVLGAYDYYCTGSDGSRHELGEVVCLINNSCSQAWLAKCDMSLNNPMWRKVQDGCPAVTLIERFQRLHPGFDATAVNPLISVAKS